MSNPFIDLALGAQAVRRKVEREIGGLGGAAGVAAVPYPHQLGNARRILADTRIRHLIADEVGLGKTVQALMVLNALRIQNPKHRALILVPADLAPQWVLECRSRGHVMPLDTNPTEETDGAFVRLAYFEQMESLTEIEPSFYDLLIVDEIQRLQSALRQRIVSAAGDFRQILLLSATPRLDDVEAYRQLLSILEPERMALAARTSAEPEEMLHQRESLAAGLLEPGSAEAWERAGFPVPPERERAGTVAATFSTARRIINTRRRDYPDILPQRALTRLPVEPTEDEVRRQEQVWKYIGFARGADAPVDLARLGQVAIRSPQALRERINVLRGRDQRDPEGFLQTATRHLATGNGDSRLEALVDLLAEIWLSDPDESVLVIAEDNPTVDYLESQLPLNLLEIGPRGSRRPLKIAKIRNRDVAASPDLVELFGAHEDLGRFERGDAQVLIAADIAQVGLNLQHARKLVFFSIPWSPQTVEQWIGRVDRLGSSALLDEESERHVDIYAIYQRGQVDERVVNVLGAFAIFRRSVRLDGEEIVVVRDHIESAALSPHTVNWEKLAAEAKKLSGDDDTALATPLSRHLPWTAERARALFRHIEEVGAIEPMIGRTRSRRAVLRWEAGLRGWMMLMGRADEFRVGGKKPDDRDHGCRLLHYWRSGIPGSPPKIRFLLPDLDPQSGQRYAYLDARHALRSPPVQWVELPENAKTPLNFLDHGNPVHEALIAGWEGLGKQAPSVLRVVFSAGHPMAAADAKGVYLLALRSWIAGRDHLDKPDHDRLVGKIQEGRTEGERQPFWDAAERIDEDFRADQRWLNGLFTPRFDVLSARLHGAAWELLDSAAACSLLTPWADGAAGKEVKLASGRSAPQRDALKAAQDAGLKLLADEHAERHRRSLAECGQLATLIAARRYQAAVEGEDLVAIRQAQLDDAAAAGKETSEQGFFRSQYRGLRSARDAALIVRDTRLARLDGLMESLKVPRRASYKTVMLLVD